MPDSRINQTPDGVFGRYLTLEERATEGEMPESHLELPTSQDSQPTQLGTSNPEESSHFPSASMDCLFRDMLDEESDGQELQELIRDQLNQELKRHSTEVMPGVRWLVNELYNRLVGPEPLRRAELLRFLRGIASAVREELSSRARRQGAHSAPDASALAYPKQSPPEGVSVTPFMPAIDEPKTVLPQESRWQSLARSAEDYEQWLAELYALANYAGRSVLEIADLFDLPEEQIRTQLALAETFIRAE